MSIYQSIKEHTRTYKDQTTYWGVRLMLRPPGQSVKKSIKFSGYTCAYIYIYIYIYTHSNIVHTEITPPVK